MKVLKHLAVCVVPWLALCAIPRPAMAQTFRVVMAPKSPVVATIDSAKDTSSVVNFEGMTEIGMIFGAIDTCTMTFIVSDASAGPWVPIKGITTQASVALVCTTATIGHRAISSADLAFLRGYTYVRLVASRSMTALRTIKFVGKQ